MLCQAAETITAQQWRVSNTTCTAYCLKAAHTGCQPSVEKEFPVTPDISVSEQGKPVLMASENVRNRGRLAKRKIKLGDTNCGGWEASPAPVLVFIGTARAMIGSSRVHLSGERGE